MLVSFNGKIIQFGTSFIDIKKSDADEISLDTPSVLSLTTKSNHGIQMIMTPSKDITFTTMSLYSSRKQTGSSDAGANASKTAVCYVGEADAVAPGTHTSIMNNSNGVIYDNNTGEWKKPTDGERIYGVPVTINDTQYYKYTSKLANGNTITLRKGKHYIIGLSTYAFMATENFAAYEYPTTDQIAYVDIDLQNRAWNKGTDVTTSYTNLYPRIDFDEEPFKYFAQQKPNYTFVRDENTILSMESNNVSTDAIADADCKLIYLVRHSERDDENITEMGFEYAKAAGATFKSKVGDNLKDDNCVFYGTTTQRTTDTANAFRQGFKGSSTREEVAIADDFLKVNFDPTGTHFNNYNWPTCAAYSNNSENNDAIQKVAEELILNCVDKLGDKKFGLFVSHDFNTLPVVTWAGQFAIDCTFDFAESDRNAEWLCYMTGVAIIVNNAEKKIYVKPMYMIDKWIGVIDGVRKEITLQSGDSGYQGKLRQCYEKAIRMPEQD